MTPPAAVPLDPTSLPDLLKRRVPFLRIDTLRRVADVVTALIQAGSTRHARLAPHLPGDSSVDAKKRRVERCLRDEQLDSDAFLRVLVPLLPPRQARLRPRPHQLGTRPG